MLQRWGVASQCPQASRDSLAGSELIGAAAALGCALAWTLASSLWRGLPTGLGAAQLNLLKNLLALCIQLPLLALLGLPQPMLGPPVGPFLLLLLSGIIGIALGDTLYFMALRRLGTRRAITLDAASPALTSTAGILLLAEMPSLQQWLGLALITLAVLLVAQQIPPPSEPESIHGQMRHGQRLGLIAIVGSLCCGVLGALLARAVLRSEAITPLQSATLRLAAASLVMLPLLRGLPQPGRHLHASLRRWPAIVLATVLGTNIAIVLQQLSLQRLQSGVAGALFSTTPIMAIVLAPLEGDRPGLIGWLAALLSIAGVLLIIR